MKLTYCLIIINVLFYEKWREDLFSKWKEDVPHTASVVKIIYLYSGLPITIVDKIYEIMSRNQAKVWYLFLPNFWPPVPKFYFLKEDWVLVFVSTHFWDFSNIFYFPKILSLKSFANSWRNSYTMSCDESNLN